MRSSSRRIGVLGIALTLCATSAAGTALCGCTTFDDAAVDSTPPTQTTTGGTVTSNGGTSGGPASTSGGPTSSSGGPTSSSGGVGAPDLASVQKRKAQMLTSFWENDTTVFQYAFARNNNDGYGYTSGRVGFTTATGDSYQVVQCFDAVYKGSDNAMKKYEPALKALYDKMIQTGSSQPSTSTLDAVGPYTADWTATSNSATAGPSFKACQDERVDLTYWAPTLPIMTKWGLTTALARASLYDATVVHGEQHVNELITQANSDIGNSAQKAAATPLSQSAESDWLKAFHVHRVDLLNSDAAWRNAIARGANYEQMRRDSNFDLTGKITTNATANGVYPGKGFSNIGYQACVINADGSVTGEPQCTAAVSN